MLFKIFDLFSNKESHNGELVSEFLSSCIFPLTKIKIIENAKGGYSHTCGVIYCREAAFSDSKLFTGFQAAKEWEM
jgi:hypothetical protein